jgi:hypothetical protein
MKRRAILAACGRAWLGFSLCGLVSFAAGQQPLVAGAPGSSCTVCHGKQGRELAESVHPQAGVTCVSCHGGVEGVVRDVAAAHGSDLKKLADPRAAVQSCGVCHADVERMRLYGLRTDQLSLYGTSHHGKRLEADGSTEVATCSSCHGSHGVLAVADSRSPVHKFNQPETCGRCHADAALMARHGARSDVVELYRRSVHGRALEQGHPSAPACTDCHGSHGAMPPRVGDVEQVCGHCHSVVQEYFQQSPHARGATTDSAVHCTSCHSNHDIQAPSPELFVGDSAGHCGACHTDAADPALAVAAKLHDDVRQLDQTIQRGYDAIAEAGSRGLFLGVERGYLDEARGLLVRARTMTHTLTPVAMTDILMRGQAMVDQTSEGLTTKQRVFRDRKIYTAIYFGVSVVFAILLLMYGRLIRGRSGGGARRAATQVEHGR